jgi:hypothetical protein
MIKHFQRCETCNYYELQPEFNECMHCNHPDFKNNIFMHEITGIEFDRIETMGCASHSSVETDSSDMVVVFKDAEHTHRFQPGLDDEPK